MKLKPLAILYFYVQAFYALGQTCLPPIVNSFTPIDVQSTKITWIDVNAPQSMSYDFRYYPKDPGVSFESFVEDFTGLTVTLPSLLAGQDYEFFIRANCASGTSDWNGPYQFRTIIDNTNSCDLNLAIKDNSCPTPSLFNIAVVGEVIGNFLQSVSLIIEHPWPADLKLQLVSPSGVSVDLVSHQGIFTQNFGDITESQCQNTTLFSDLACTPLVNGLTNLTGSFQPEQALKLFGQENNGLWKLSICDRAAGDIGIIKYVKLNFSAETCQVPQLVALSQVTDKSITIKWDDAIPCNRVVINHGPLGYDPDNGTLDYVLCSESSFTLTNLQADTEYEFSVRSECGLNDLSPYSCSTTFKTLCRPPFHIEDFNFLNACSEFCLQACVLESSWTNLSTDDVNWIPGSGPTPTLFTGPESAVYELGKYLYLENQTEVCGGYAEAIVQSPCAYVLDDGSACDLHFYYTMYGNDVQTLKVNVLTQNNESLTVWQEEGDQGQGWQTAEIDLSAFKNTIVNIQFIAYTGNSNFSDIAIDEVAFLGLDPFDESLTYYVDNDGDTYGQANTKVYGCQYANLDGYSQLGGDCDDSNPNIHPNMQELPCNGIDENCNGVSDDLSKTNIQYAVTNIQSSVCGGDGSGAITIEASQGLAPYSIEWSNGQMGSNLTDLIPGLYFATITDLSGCTRVTESIEILAENTIQFAIQSIQEPTCVGSLDGSIQLLVGQDVDTYTILWNSGQNTVGLDNLDQGSYQATITNQDGCVVTTDTIHLTATTQVLAGVQLKRDVTCNGGNNGQILVNSISSDVLNYSWSHGPTTNQLTNLAAGLYTVTVNNPNTGCQQIIADIPVTQPEPLSYTFDNIEQNLCNGDTDGAIYLSAFGGVPPYSFAWSSGDFTDDIIRLEGGEYVATITDSKGCSLVTDQIEIANPPEITLGIVTIGKTTCIGSNDGFIDINSEGGTGDLFYQWNTGSNQSEDIANIFAGIYSVTVVDEVGCKEALRNISVTSQGIILQSNIKLVEAIDCNDTATGSIAVTLTGGTPTFDYNWNDGTQHITSSNRDTLTMLSSGLYSVTITDSNGCTSISNTFQLTEPDPLLFSVLSITDATCFGSADGEIVLGNFGGDYSVLWNIHTQDSINSNLPSGYYTATISDDDDCSMVTDSIFIEQPATLILDYDVVHQTSANLGSISYTALGGSPPYMLSLDGSLIDFTGQITGLVAGDYTLNLIDNNQCDTTILVTVQLLNSIEDTNLTQLSIYPNPTSDKLYIRNSSQASTFSIFSLEGKCLALDISAQQYVDVSYLSAGLYFLSVQMKDGKQLLFKVLVN